MKQLKNKISYTLYFVLVAVFLAGCSEYGQDYKYTYTAKITYTDSAVDTVKFDYDSFKGNPVNVYLKISDSGLLASGGTSPCLMVGCGFYNTAIACGVRKYEIINEVKVAINGN
tara:strand:+ start:424 stop:765 length:342 start_codon:yes stop_codon:yes gene_type:complete